MRWFWLTFCGILGLGMVLCGLLMPVYLRAVDAHVLKSAEGAGHSLVEDGLALASQRRVGAAGLVLQVAQTEDVFECERLSQALTNAVKTNASLLYWGGDAPRWANLFGDTAVPVQRTLGPFSDLLAQPQNRERLLAGLGRLSHPTVQELLKLRTLTNTLLFPPSASAAGEALDAAVGLCGLLLEEECLMAGLRSALEALARESSRGGTNQRARLEQALLDLVSLAQRLNWGQLVAFVGPIEDTETLRFLAHQARQAPAQLPVLFCGVVLSGNPAGVAKYLKDFSETGFKDLRFGVRLGVGGLHELLERKQPVFRSGWRPFVVEYDPFKTFYGWALEYCWRMPWYALRLKWLSYLLGGYLIATALHLAQPATPLKQTLQARGFHVARELLFALGFLLVMLLLSEPFLFQESQKAAFPFRLHLPMVGSAVPARTPPVRSSIMNQLSLISLVLFFTLQALLYTACLVRLAEVRRQNLPPRIKLKLLDNEDHLFDAGLYLGFVGTIISLILVSLGVIQPSLMAAYSSTSFGIVFVSIFKIFHLRPLRRKLLLKAEGVSDQPRVPASSSSEAETVLPP